MYSHSLMNLWCWEWWAQLHSLQKWFQWSIILTWIPVKVKLSRGSYLLCPHHSIDQKQSYPLAPRRHSTAWRNTLGLWPSRSSSAKSLTKTMVPHLWRLELIFEFAGLQAETPGSSVMLYSQRWSVLQLMVLLRTWGKIQLIKNLIASESPGRYNPGKQENPKSPCVLEDRIWT